MESNPEKEAQIYKNRWWTFLVLALAILIVVIDHTILTVALPTLQRELGATISELQWIVDAYIMAFATLLLTMGTLGDRMGRSTILRAGMIVFGLASLIAVMATSAGQVVFARVFMGIGAAMILPSTLAIITNIFPPKERGKAIGAWGAMNGLGVALGPLLGGLLLEYLNWRYIFFINIPIVVLALVAGFFLVPNSRDPHPRSLDIGGTLLSAIALLLLIFGLIKASDWGWTNITVLSAFTGAIMTGLFFILWQYKANTPMVDLQLFRNSRLPAGAGALAMMTVAMFGVLFAFTLFMQFVRGYSALETGIRFLPMAFGYAFGSITCNRMVGKWGTKLVVTAGFIGMAVLALVIAFWQLHTPFWQIGILLFIFSYCMGNIMTPSLNAVLGSVPKTRAGVGSAIGNVSFQTGGALGVAALGSILSTVYREKITPALTSFSSLPAEMINTVKESAGAAAAIAEMLPKQSETNLVQIAGQSFMAGWQMVLLIVSIIGIIGTILMLKFMPASETRV
jgi:EmrB/QacA subfamily drug resistance transporter